MWQLKNKVAVVTGGSSGIGLATVQRLLEAGAAVAFCGRDAQRLADARATLMAQWPDARLLAAQCDVRDARQMAAFADEVQARWGPASVLVNNAGQGRVSTFATTDDGAWQEELHLKFFSVIHPTRAFLPQLQAAPAPAIVCVNSLLAVQPEPHMVATSAARAGVHNLVRSLAIEFAPFGIRVNAVLLGLVDSGQWRRRFAARDDPSLTWADWSARLAADKGIPLARLGDPADAANAICFLASPLAAYTTGGHIDISGGLSRHA